MGIQGLLPFLKKIHTPVNIAQFQGCTVAIDAYCWLHKGAFSCAEKLALKEDTNQYVYYCMKYIDYILRKDIKPILVFDGCHLESKADVEKTRRERRELHRQKAAQFLREGKRSEAKECLQRCIDITPQMALKLMQACRDKGVDCIVAPYEADAQLAYLNLSGIAQVIVTEDSDLLLFGCEKVIFKMDIFGNGTLIEKARLNEVMSVQNGFYTFEKFRHMCILSGCDYLPSLPGIGLAKANKVFKLARQGDVKQLLKKLPTYLKMNVAVSDNYVEGFIRADNTFLHQLVFDPLNRELKPLNPYPPEVQGVDLKYAGHHISRQMAYQIALGNIDIHTREVIADFDPDTFVAKHPMKTKHRYYLSIWSKNYAVKSSSPCKEIQSSALPDPSHKKVLPQSTTTGRTRVIKLSRATDDHQNPILKVNEITEVYETTRISPKKGGKKRIFDSLNDDSEEVPLRRKPDNCSVSISDEDQFFSDENDCSPVKKRSKIKDSPKFIYNAANIGEETFKEESTPQSKDTNRAESLGKSRNVFAVSKAPKSTVETKSKYFSSASPSSTNKLSKQNKSPTNKTHDSDSSKNTENISDTCLKDIKKDMSKKETLKLMTLKDMFKNLKEKKAVEGDNQAIDSQKPVIETMENKVGISDKRNQHQQKFKPLSVFSWSKFKCQSSDDSINSRKSNSCMKSQSNLDKKDSFSEMLKNDIYKTTSMSGELCSKPSDNSTFSLDQDDSEMTSENCPSLKDNKNSDVKELRSESYASFLKSITSHRSEVTNNDEPEREQISENVCDGESPFPEDHELKEMTCEGYVENVECSEFSSQEEVIDLTNDFSQTSDKSRTSSSSGRSSCRVSGLSRKRDRPSKKPETSKSESSQRSIKDLFSKFAFKKETDTALMKNNSECPTDSLEDSLDDDQQFTPTTKPLDTDNVALVRRKLKL